MSEAPDLYGAGSLDEAAGRLLADMYARRAKALYGLCRMMLRDVHEAEDALQSTFLSAHRALIGGTRPREEAAWLATIARNECRGRIRERMRRPVTTDNGELEAVADTTRTPADLLADDGVGKALAALPESQREAVVLHDVFGLRAREVGVALGLSVPAVEAALFRARRQLRTRLRPVGASALSLPLGVQEALSGQIPGFAAGGAGTAVVGAGLIAKVVATPTVLKLAAGAAALATVGSVAAVETQRPPSSSQPSTQLGSQVGSSPSVGGKGDQTATPTAANRAAVVDGHGQGADGSAEHATAGNDSRNDGHAVGAGSSASAVNEGPGSPTQGGGRSGSGKPSGPPASAATGGEVSPADDAGTAVTGGSSDAGGSASSAGSGGSHGRDDDATVTTSGPGSGDDGTATVTETGDDGGSGSSSSGGQTSSEGSSGSGKSGGTDDPPSDSGSGSGKSDSGSSGSGSGKDG